VTPQTKTQAHLVSLVICEVKFGRLGHKVHAGLLSHELHVNGLVGLDTNDELIAARLAIENVAGHLLELDAHLGLALVQRLATLHDERHAVPPLVLDLHDRGGEGGRARAGRHRRVVQVAQPLVLRRPVRIADVLAEHNVLQPDARYRLEHLDLLVANVLGVLGRGRFHRDQRQYLLN